MLQAKADWYWFYDLESHTLRLNMTEFTFVTACKASKLLPNAKQTQSFNVADNQSYCEFYAVIEEQLGLSEAACVQIALNAVAQTKFVRPEQPKSWYFVPQKHAHKRTMFEQVVLLQSQYASAEFLILEENKDCANLMLLSKSLQLDERKIMKQFECIKVLQDRISSLPKSTITRGKYQA
ncbi:hypothetical protein DS2_01510 [Catenovulum agarivorans DS-2]|uniref:Cell division protein ZapC n=1 Tax=Catenovulum agarivorans DS-2 TaxID=1328313 RepID=W7QTK4_9ALTE|nr:cell division protein ZapC domain-containing protein [Catenovulum agarivorans]EWH12357.1 hypothetical protein DS2_01510 [Catenovulum agarivorans DS-2]